MLPLAMIGSWVIASVLAPPQLPPDATHATAAPKMPAETPEAPADAGTPAADPVTPTGDPIPASVEPSPATPLPPATLPPATTPVRRPPVEQDLPPSSSAHRSSAPTPRPSTRQPFFAPSTRSGFIHLSVGNDQPIRNVEYGFANLGSLNLEQAIGGHIAGGSGAALAFVTQQTFATDAYAYVFAARFQYDVAVSPAYAVYLSPSLTLGYRRVRDGGVDEGPCFMVDCERVVAHQATFQLGLGLVVVIADRLPLTFRPLVLDIGVPHISGDGEPAFSLRWHILGGLGLNFGASR